MTSSQRGFLLVASAALCWSSGGLIARLVETDPWTTNAWRGAFAATFLMLAVRLAEGRGLIAQWRSIGWPGIGVAVNLAIASTCFILALARTSVANTLLLMSVGPYVAGLLGWLWLGERVRPRTWLAMGAAVAGTGIMVSGSYGTRGLSGDLLALGMACGFATATVLVRRHPEIRMTPAAALAAALTALVALPMATPFAASGRDVGLLALFGIGQFAVGFLLFTRGARLIPAAHSVLIGLLETVLGPFWVWLLLGETPASETLVGGGVILTALAGHAALELAPRRERPIASPPAAPVAARWQDPGATL